MRIYFVNCSIMYVDYCSNNIYSYLICDSRSLKCGVGFGQNLWSGQKVYGALVYHFDNILLDLELNFISKLLVFRWELIVLLLLQICFCFVMREIS